MASSSRGKYSVFEPSSGPTYEDPAPKATITNPFEIDSQFSHNPEIQSFEYEPTRVVNQEANKLLGDHSRAYASVMFVGDAFLSLLPVLFIILGFRALAVNGQPVSDAGRTVIEAAKLGPTAFPIIFAAVVGRLMRTYALWKAERGTRLGVLEQLVGSQNLLASIERVFVLRNYTILGLSILTLWALSPLGGQSALRVLGTKSSGGFGTQRVYYFNTTNGEPNDSSFLGADAIYTNDAAMSSVYRASLLAPNDVQTSAVDLWSNPKVPFLEDLPSYAEGSSEWLEVPNTTNASYSSLTGIMVANLPARHTSNFSIQTSYFRLLCTNPTFFTMDETANFTTDPSKFYGGFLEWLGHTYFTPNKSQNVFGFTANQSTSGEFTPSSFMLDTNWNYRTGNPLKAPINLLYASQGAANEKIAAFNCTVGTRHVEANLMCSGTTGRNCRVDRMRRSLSNLTPNTSTPLNQGDTVYIANFLSWFVFAAGQMHSGVMSPTDLYLSGSNSPFSPIQPGSIAGISDPYQDVTGHDFSMRFSRLINTVWQTSMATTSIAQPPPSNLSELAAGGAGYNAANTTADTVLFTEVYEADKVWVALTLIISFVLLICGIAGHAFKYMASAPDILGYVSTMTRDNPYFNVTGPSEVREQEGDEGSDMGVLGGMRNRVGGKRRGSGTDVKSGDRLDGLERARLLRNTRVQIANVKPWSQGGHVALRSVGT